MSPCWHFFYLKQSIIVFLTRLHTYSSEQDQLPKELKPHSQHVNKTSALPPLAESSKGAPHSKSHCTFSSLPSNSLGDTRAWSFSIRYSQSKHHKWDFHITRSKISYSLIEPQPLPSTPACGHEFHALAFHPHPTFAAPPVGSAFKIWSEICGRVFFQKQSTSLGHWLFLQRSSIVDVLQLCLRRFPTLELHKGRWTPPAS